MVFKKITPRILLNFINAEITEENFDTSISNLFFKCVQKTAPVLHINFNKRFVSFVKSSSVSINMGILYKQISVMRIETRFYSFTHMIFIWPHCTVVLFIII
jgi:hypothetical protein